MPNILVPTRMPRGIADRKTSGRTPMQVLQPVRGLEMGQIEQALVHLAAHRLLPAPGSVRETSVTTGPSWTTCRVRIAQPIYCRFALVSARIRASGVSSVTGTFRANSDYQSSYTGGTFSLTDTDALSIPLSLVIEIGGPASAPTANAHAAAYQTINVQAQYSGGGTCTISEVWATPLPCFGSGQSNLVAT